MAAAVGVVFEVAGAEAPAAVEGELTPSRRTALVPVAVAIAAFFVAGGTVAPLDAVVEEADLGRPAAGASAFRFLLLFSSDESKGQIAESIYKF